MSQIQIILLVALIIIGLPAIGYIWWLLGYEVPRRKRETFEAWHTHSVGRGGGRPR